MNRGLTFAATLAVCLLAANPAVAQGVRADTGGIAIGRDVIGSTINIGVPLEKIDELVRERTKPFEELTSAQKETIGLLREKLDLNRRQITAALNILGEANVEPENLTAKLAEVAERYKELLASAASQPGDTPAIAARKAEAQQALDAGDLDKADALLAAVQTEQRQVLNRAALNLAETSARRGDLAMTRLRYREAARYFADAAALLAPGGSDEDKRIGYLEKEAAALYRQGTHFGETDAVRSAIERCRVLIELKPRDRVPLKWAWAEYDLGVVLSNLGERENGTARFEEALAAYTEAQKELTRASQPAAWAMVESRRGHTLRLMGMVEQGTARFAESIAAYREALQVFEDQHMPLARARAQQNLAVALARLGERGGGTAELEEAVAAYRKALDLYPREQSPSAWAVTQSNLGSALRALGARERGTSRLEEAVVAHREALKEWTRERAPLPWAAAQDDLAQTLVMLARREHATAGLEEAIATYDEALKGRLRERNPGLWAGSTGRQGIALMILAERTNNADMAERAVAQIEAALEVWRGRENARAVDFFDDRLRHARALAQRLRQP
jgi:tetratricopeptide (TPR) repeat protein